ncbi:MAG: shikimate kinase [Coriobacteriia bacterium]|jgi:shikimate kinase|nr:shikimate kinase [Coriobacteriia bacterium]
MNGHLFLVGFMGAGKSSVGRLVAGRLGLSFVDLDERIEAREGTPVAELFRRDGEQAFRVLETDALQALSTEDPSVVACGGGIIVLDENRRALKRLGRVVYLVVDAAEALARIGDTATRPLLSGPSGTMAATSLLGARKSLYAAVADVTVDTVGRTAEEVADLVIAATGGEEV